MPAPIRPRPPGTGTDHNRRLAELLVEGGIISRRDAEAALREARRGGRSLVNVLLHTGRLKSQFVTLVRRLELLLARQPNSFHLSELLQSSGEITAAEFRRIQETRVQTGRAFGDVLVRDGYLHRGVRPGKQPQSGHWAAAVIAGMVIGTLGMTGAPARVPAPSAALSAGDARSLAPLDAGDDLRFVSLGDITLHLKRLQQRPTPYRKQPSAPLLTGSVKQRIKQYRPLVNQYARQYKLPPQLILALIEQESSFNPQAHSRGNAVGLMQLVPHGGARAAYHFSERRPGTPTLQELQDPKTNIRLGTAYLRLLLDRHFDDIKDEDVRVAIALAAYNWGPTRMRRALKSDGIPGSLDDVEALLKKHAPAETQDYVREITDRMETFG